MFLKLKIICLIFLIEVTLIKLSCTTEVIFIPREEVYEWEQRPSDVKSWTKYLDLTNLYLEALNETTIEVGGYAISMIDFPKKEKIRIIMNVFAQEKAEWKDVKLKFGLADACADFIDPTKVWHNFTKLITICPPSKGTKMYIPTQHVNVKLNVPSAYMAEHWKVGIVVSWGIPYVNEEKYGLALFSDMVVL